MRKRDKLKQKLIEHSFKDIRWVESLVLLVTCVFLLFAGGIAKADERQCTFIENLSPYQQEVAYKVYRAGSPYDLGLTAIAIAWEESKLGLYKVRYNPSKIFDQSFGLMHTVAKWKIKGMNPFEAGMWVQKMLDSDDYSIQVGVQDILYWQQAAKGDWKKGVGMYNGGYKGNIAYANRISTTVSEIKHCKF